MSSKFIRFLVRERERERTPKLQISAPARHRRAGEKEVYANFKSSSLLNRNLECLSIFYFFLPKTYFEYFAQGESLR